MFRMNVTFDRRSFLAAATLAVGGCATSPRAHFPITDTHTHFYDPTRPQGVPWPDKDDPILYRPVLPTEYRRLAEPLGITGTLVVEASPWIEDNQWVLDLAAKDSFIVGLVGHLKPGHPDFAAQLDRFARNPLFRGIRTGLWDVKIEAGRPEFIRDLELLAERNLALDLLIGPDQLKTAALVGKKVPGLRIVVNHCANVPIDSQQPPNAWVEGIVACHYQPNINLKVSGLVEGTGRTDGTAPASVDFYRRVLDAVWGAFGEDRIVYGSNWPVSARFASLATVQRLVYEYFGSHGSTAAQKYFHTNAKRIYRFTRRNDGGSR